MHTALLLDRERLMHERGMLQRVIAGLLKNGISITVIEPNDEQTPALEVETPDNDVALRRLAFVPGTRWRRRRRFEHVAQALAESKPDVLYIVGAEAWADGLELARATQCPVALDVWSGELVKKATRLARKETIDACIVPNPALGRAMAKKIEPELISTVPFGVEASSDVQAPLSEARGVIGLMILGTGRDVEAYRMLLGGLRQLAEEIPDLTAFLELRGVNDHDIWSIVKKFDLLDRVSCLTDVAAFRPLLTSCHAVVVPERFGHVRSIVLEAMAAGLPVMTADDGLLGFDDASDPITQVVTGKADAWASRIGALCSAPGDAAAMARRAQSWVERHHNPAHQVRALAATFECVQNGGAMPFSQDT